MLTLSWLWSKIGGYVIGGLTILGALAAVWGKGRRDGIKKIEAEQNEARLDAIEKRKTFDDKVGNLSDDDLDRQLAEWVRKQPPDGR